MKMRRKIWERVTAVALAAVMSFSPISYSSAFAGEAEAVSAEERVTEAPMAESLPETLPEEAPAPEPAPAPQEEAPAPVQEAPPPQEETPAPAPEPETPAPQVETQAPQPETPAPQVETQAPATEAAQSETPAPEQGTEAPEQETQAPTEAQTLEIEGMSQIAGSAGSWDVVAFMSDGSEFAQGSSVKVERVKDIVKEGLLAEGFAEDTGDWKKAMDERTSALQDEILNAGDAARWEAYASKTGADASQKDAYIAQRNASEIFDRALRITVTDPDGNEYPKGKVDFLVSVKNDDLYGKFVKNGGYTADFISYEYVDAAGGGKEYRGTPVDHQGLMYGDLLMDGRVSVMIPEAESGFYSFSFYGADFAFDSGNGAGDETVENTANASEEDSASASAQQDVYEMKADASGIVVTVQKADGGVIPEGSVLTVKKAGGEDHIRTAAEALWNRYAENNGLDAEDGYYRDAFVSWKLSASDLASSWLIALTGPDGSVQSDLVVTAEFRNDELYSKTVSQGERYELVTFDTYDGQMPDASEPVLRNTEAFTYGYFAEDGMACFRLAGGGSGVYSVFADAGMSFELPPEEGRPAPETEAPVETESETEAVTEVQTEEADTAAVSAKAGGVTVTVKKADGSDLPEGSTVEIEEEDGIPEAEDAKDTVSHKWATDLRDSIDYMRFIWDASTSDLAARFYTEETSGMTVLRLSVKDAEGNEISDDLSAVFEFDAGTKAGRSALDGRLDMYRLSEDVSSAEAGYEVETAEEGGSVLVSTTGQANRIFVFAGSVDRKEFGVTEYENPNTSGVTDEDILEQIRELKEDEENAGLFGLTVMNAGLSDLGDRYSDEEIANLHEREISDDNIAGAPQALPEALSEAEEANPDEGGAGLETEESIRTQSADEEPEEADEEDTAEVPEEAPASVEVTDGDGMSVESAAKAASAAFDDNLLTNRFSLECEQRILLRTYGWHKNLGGGGGNYMLKVNGRYYEIYCIEPRVSGAVSDSANKKIVTPLTSATSSRQIQFRKLLYYCAPKKRGANGEIKMGAYWKAHTGYTYGAKYILNHFALAYINGKEITGTYYNAVNSTCASICYDMINWCNRQPDPLVTRPELYFYKVESGNDNIQDSVTMTARSAIPKTPPVPYKRVSTAYSEANLGPNGTVSNDLGTYGTEYYYRISQPVGQQPDTAEVTSLTFADTLPQGVKINPSTWSVTATDGRNLTGLFRMTTGMSGIRQTIRVVSTGSLGTDYSNVTINLTFRAILSRDDIYDHTDNSSSKYTAGNGRVDYTVYNYGVTTIQLHGGGLTVNGGGTTNRVVTTANSVGLYPSVSKGVHAGVVASGAWLISDWTDTINDPFQYRLRVAIPKNDRVFMMQTLKISDTLPHGIDGMTDSSGKARIKVYNNLWKDETSKYSIVLSPEDNDDNQTITITRRMTAEDRIDTSASELWIVVDCSWDRMECSKYRLKKNVVNPDGSINIFYGPDTNDRGEDARVLNHFQLDTTFSNMPDNKLISNDVRIQTKAVIPSANTKHIEPSVEKYVRAKELDSEWKLITETKDPGENFRYRLVIDTRQTQIPDTTADAEDRILTAGDLSKVRDCFNSDLKINLTSGNITVPEYAVIGDRLVRIVGIADGTFRNAESITRITLPDSVQSIGASAFEGCTNLKSVNIPSKLKTLGARAFYGCSELRAGGGVMFIPGKVGTIKAGTFYGCQDFSVAFCEGITSVEAGALENTRWMAVQVADGCTMDENALRGGFENIVVFHTEADMSDYTGGGDGTESASGVIDAQETYTSMTVTDALPAGCRYVSTVSSGPFSVSCDNGHDLTASSSSVQAESVYEIEIECEWVPEDCRDSGNLRFDKDDKIYYYGPLYNNFMLDYEKESRINSVTTDVKESKKSNTVSVRTKEFQPVQTEPQKWIDMDGEIATRDDLDTLKVIHDLYDPSDNTVTFVIRQEIPRTYMWSLRDIKFYDPIINKLDISEISFSYNSNVPDPEYGTWTEEANELKENVVAKAIDGETWALRVTTQNTIDVMNLSSLSGDIESKIGVTAELRIVSSIESARNALDGTYYWEWTRDPELPKGDHAFWTVREEGSAKHAVARIPNRAKTTVTYECPDDYPYTDYENETQTVWVEAQLPAANIVLNKRNQYDESVLGATFAVYEWNSGEGRYDEEAVTYLVYSEQLERYVLPENVYLKRDGYNQGKFKIVEIITPDGYADAVNTDRTPFSGEVEIAAGQTELQEIEVDVYEEYLGMNIELLKIVSGTESEGYAGDPLAGAVFEVYAREDIKTPEGHVIYRNDGAPIETGITTDGDGRAVSAEKYYPGKYILYETEAPRDPETGKPYGIVEPQEFEIVSADGVCVMLWGGMENNFVTQLSGPDNITLNLDLSGSPDYVDYGFTAENFFGSLVSTVPMKYRLTVDLNQRLDQGLTVKLLDGAGEVLSTAWMENGNLRSSGTVNTTVMYGTTTPRLMYESDSFVFATAGSKEKTPYTVRIEGDEAKVFYDYGIGDNDNPAYKVRISIDGSIADIEGDDAKIADEPNPVLFPVVRKYVNDADENDWKIYTSRDGRTEYEREVLYKLHTTFYKNDPDSVTQFARITDTIPRGLNFTGQWEAVMGGADISSGLELTVDGPNLTFETTSAEFAESLEGNGEPYSTNDMDIILHCVWNRDEYDPDLLEGHLVTEDPYVYSEKYGPVDNMYDLYTTYLSGEDHTTQSNIVKADIHIDTELLPRIQKWIMNGTEKLVDRTFAEWDAVIPYRVELDTTDGDWTGIFTPTLIRIEDTYEDGLTYAKADDTFALEINGETVSTWSYGEIVEPEDAAASTVKNGWDVAVDGNTMYVFTQDPDAIGKATNAEIAVLTKMTLTENEAKLDRYWTDETHLTVPNKASGLISFEPLDMSGGDETTVLSPPDIELETQVVTANFEIDTVNLEIYKTDALTGDAVKNAEFTIYEWNTALEDGAGAYDTRTVEEGGKAPTIMTYSEEKGCYVVPGGKRLFVKSTNLGKFKAVETKVPDGYGQAVEKEFTKDDAVDRLVTLNLVNEMPSVKLNLAKFDAADGTTPVAGAVYELRCEEIVKTPSGKTVRIPQNEGGTLDYIAGETIDTLTTDAEGKAVSTVDLYPGKYYLQEISAPEPYKVSEDPVRFEVTVDEDGAAHTVFTDTLHPEDREGDDVEYTDLVRAYDEPPILYPDLVKYVLADNESRGETGDWDLYHWTPDIASQFKYRLQVKIPENIDATKLDSFVLTDELEEGADIVRVDRITTKKFRDSSNEISADEMWFQEDQALTGFTSIPVTIAFDDDDDADGRRQSAIAEAAGPDGKLVIGLDEILSVADDEGHTGTSKTRLTSQEAEGGPLGTVFTNWTTYDDYNLLHYDGANEYDPEAEPDSPLYDEEPAGEGDPATALPAESGGLWGDTAGFVNSEEMQALMPADSPMSADTPKYIVYTGVSAEDGSGGTPAGYIDYIAPPEGDTPGVIHLFGKDGYTAEVPGGIIRIVPVDGVEFDDASKLVRVPVGEDGVSRNRTYSVAPPELNGYTWTVSRKGRSVTVTYTKAGEEKDASAMFSTSTSGDVLTLTATGDVSKLEGNMLYVYVTCKWDEAEAKAAGHYRGYTDSGLTGLRYYHMNDFDIATSYRSGHTFRRKSNEVKVETWKSFTLPSFRIIKYITEGGEDFKARDDSNPESDPYIYERHPKGVPYRIDTMIDNLSDPIAAFSSFMITDTFIDALEITGATAIVNGTRMPWTQEEFGTEKEILGMPFILEVAGQDITLSAPNGLPLSAYGKKVSVEVETRIREDNNNDPFKDPYNYTGFMKPNGTRQVYRNKDYRVTENYHTEVSFPNVSQASAMFGKTLDGDRIGNPIDRISNEVWVKFQYDYRIQILKTQAPIPGYELPEGEPVRVPGAEFVAHPYDDEKGEYDMEAVAAALEWDDATKTYLMADNKWIFKTDNNRQGKFLLEEFVTPEGYKQAPNQEFTLTPGADGQIHLEVSEELARMNLSLYKIDDNTKGEDVDDIPLEGAVYGVYARDDVASVTRDGDVINVIYPAFTLIDVLVTGADGYAESLEGHRGEYTYRDAETDSDVTVSYNNLGYYPGKYYIQELQAPDGYDLDTKVQHFEVTTDTRQPNGTGVTLWHDPTGSNDTEKYIDTDSETDKYDKVNSDGIGTVPVTDTPSKVSIKIKKNIDRIEEVRWPENGKVTFEFLIRGTARSGEQVEMRRAITFIKSDYTGMTGPVTLEKEVTDLPVGEYEVVELRRSHFKLASLTVEATAGNTASKTFSPTRGTSETSIPAQVPFAGALSVKFYDEDASARPSAVTVKVNHPKTGGGTETYASPSVPLNADGEGSASVAVTGGTLADAWIVPQTVSGYTWYYTHSSANGFDITYVAEDSKFGSISAEDEYAMFDLHTSNAQGTAQFNNTKRNDEWHLHVKKANAHGDPLENAAFAIFSDAALTREVASGTTDDTGEYVSPLLQEGIYYLEETKSAAGYSLLANAVEITASSGSDSLVLKIDGELVGSDTSAPIYATTDAEGVYHLFLNITNQEGFTLPMTGAPLQIGLVILVVAAAAGAVFVIVKKKKKKVKKA